MHIHILGICGTFMGGVALLARALGMKVSGADAGVYPPMSTQLAAEGIQLIEGYDAQYIDRAKPDLVVIGNAMSRGNESVEHVLNRQLNYCSGPAFVSRYILRQRWVLAVAGTHGKTSTSSMLAWILEYANMNPGFLIGGIPQNFSVSARLGKTPFFVIEADEYDTAFFDKRSKFLHYHPRTLVINNLEFDHADIFDTLADIKRQFHHLLRIVPGDGRIISPVDDENINDVLAMGCWSSQEKIDRAKRQGWWAKLNDKAGNSFDVGFGEQCFGTLNWDLIGEHNVNNALAAIAAARHVGVLPAQALDALAEYINTRRRMEIRGQINNITVYDDFAHHPTAIALTLEGLRNKVGKSRIIAVLEPRSNTMKSGFHKHELAKALEKADQVFVYQPSGLQWSLQACLSNLDSQLSIMGDVERMIDEICVTAESDDHIVIMSNGGFENIHQRLLDKLAATHAKK